MITNEHTGWLGIDVGTWAVKLAQVERGSHGWRLAARHTYAWPQALDTARLRSGDLEQLDELLEGFQADFRRRRSIFKGRLAAVSLPAELAPLRQMQLPRAEGEELRAMIAQELDQELGESPDAPFGFWVNGSGMPNSDELLNITAVVADENLTSSLVSTLRGCSLEVAVIDAQACSLARAASLTLTPGEEASLTILVDIGNNSTSVVMSQQGIPLHTRLLRNHGVQNCVAPLAEQLGIECQDAFHLLAITGVTHRGAEASFARDWINDILFTPLASLADQVSRTVQFFQSRCDESVPIQIRLCGGGAAITGISEWMSDRLQLPVQVWRLNSRELDSYSAPHNLTLAGAAALSCLAWEPAPCM